MIGLAMLSDIIQSSWEVRSSDIIKEKPAIKMSPAVIAAAKTLNTFLFEKVYNVRAAQEETEKTKEVVRFLYRYFMENADKLPAEYRLHADTIERGVADYIAGMTDQYAIRLAEELKNK